MGCSPFANSRFQMGVTVMGFAEDFGHYHFPPNLVLVTGKHGNFQEIPQILKDFTILFFMQ